MTKLPHIILLISTLLLVNFFNLYSKSVNKIVFEHNFNEFDTVSEKRTIYDAVEKYYIGGISSRDFSLIRFICIEDATLYGVRNDGSLSVTTLDKWSHRFDPENPPFNSLDYDIEKIDYTGTAAQVKIRFVLNGDIVIYDYLNMLKIEKRWRIINIIDY